MILGSEQKAFMSGLMEHGRWDNSSNWCKRRPHKRREIINALESKGLIDVSIEDDLEVVCLNERGKKMLEVISDVGETH